MGEAFDPEWEYYVPDPEIECVMQSGHRLTLIEMFLDDRIENRQENRGVRFGKGNPNKARLYLARERVKWKEETPAWKVCKGCKNWFEPRNKETVYCSLVCSYPNRGRRRVLPLERTCKICNRRFKPKEDRQKCCSKRCGLELAGRTRKMDVACNTSLSERLKEFAIRYINGDKIKTICQLMGVTKATTKRWKRKLGLVVRPIGRAKS